MSLIETSSGEYFMFDCNITDENEDDVLGYVAKQIGWYTNIKAFICSHRDADHMRGIKKLHEYFPIQKIWDSGYQGTSTNTTEYTQYMQLRRTVGAVVKEKQKRQDFGRTRFRFLSAQDTRLAKNANAQGIVLKVEHRSANLSAYQGSVMLTGDSDAETWRHGVQEDYDDSDLSCEILVAGHHGSITFFDDPGDKEHYYTRHVQAMSPDMTIVSVGKNSHGHPDAKAIELYKKYSSGSSKGNKLYRTDQKGNMRVELKDGGGWNLKINL
jgi:beta-lactamase superfamily II metal-dependent hydrolase